MTSRPAAVGGAAAEVPPDAEPFEPPPAGSADPRPATPGDRRGVLVALMLAVFCVGTSEYVVAGLLPLIAADLAIPVTSTGVLITGYAATVTVAGPLLTLAAARVARRHLLTGLLLLFVAGSAAAALAPSLELLVAARIVVALAHGPVVAVALVVAARTAAPGRSGRALARIAVALNFAIVAGVPIGSALGSTGGWRVPFAILTAAGLVTAVAVFRVVPAELVVPAGARHELRAVLRPAVQIAVVLTVLATAGGYAVYTYIGPVLTEAGGFELDRIDVLLLVFGAGSLTGSMVGGRLTDAGPGRALALGSAVLTVSLAGFAATLGHGWWPIPALFTFGFGFFLIVPPLGAYVVEAAGQTAPTLAVSLNVAAFNLSIALGSWTAGLLLDNGTSLTTLVWWAAAATFPAVLLATAAAVRGRK